MADASERWQAQTEYDLSVAELLYRQSVYRYCVFFCHLSLEKQLKAMLIERTGDEDPPRTHDLIELAALIGIDLSAEYHNFMFDLSKQSVAARYSEVSTGRYNEEHAASTLTQVREVHEWLKSKTASSEEGETAL